MSSSFFRDTGPAFPQLEPAVVEAFKDEAAASAASALSSETSASASATAAASSASSAATSATNAATSETNAGSSASTATAAATVAAGQATVATTQAGNASTSATNAASSATAAAGSATAAAGSATTASTQAGNASTSATNAASSASAAATSASNAATAVQAAAGTATPLVDGTAAVGTSTKWAREDHVHPSGSGGAYVPKASDVGGRLTALSASPVPSVDVVASQNLYLAPFGGKMFPLYSSAAWALHQFTSSSTDQVGLTLALAGSANWPAGSVHDVFGVLDAGTLKIGTRAWDAGMLWTEALITPSTTLASGGAAGYITTGTTGPSWSAPQTAFDGTTNKATASSATNAQTTNTFAGANAICTFLGQDWGSGVTNVISKVVVTAPNDGYFCGGANAAFTFQIEGSNNGTDWHRISITRFNDTLAMGAVFTCPINVTETNPYRMIRVGFDSNGVNNVKAAQIQFYKRVAPANGRRLTFLDGMRVNDASMTVRTGATTTITTAQYEGFFIGTIKIDDGANGSITQHSSGGPNRVYGICNAYNKVPIKLDAFSYAPVTSYTPVTSQLWNQIESAVTGGGGITIQMVDCLSDNPVKLEIKRNVYLNCITAVASYESGIAVDTTLNFSGMEATCNTDSTGQAIGYLPTGVCIPPPVAGVRNFYGIERQGNNGAGSQSVSTGTRNSAFTAEFLA